MSLLVKRASSSELTGNSEPAARRPPSARKSKSAEVKSIVDRTADLLATWGAGKFNADDDLAYTEYFTEDVLIDSRGDHAVAEYKMYHGIEGAKAWFDFVGSFELEGLEMSHVAGPTPDEVWLRATAASSTSKKTGKGAAYIAYSIFTWKDGKCAKIVNVPFHSARTAAILSEEDVPVPPMVALPSFEPHPEPMTAYTALMGLWGSGELNQPEVFKKYVAEDSLVDVTDSSLPHVLKAYEGFANVREWNDHTNANWEMSNVEVLPVAGLSPGCVTHRFTADMKHRVTGKEAKGVQCYVELAYNTDGKFVYARHYWVDAPKLASIYVLDELSDI